MKYIFILMLSFLPACAQTYFDSFAKNSSAGPIGCTPENISVSNVNFNLIQNTGTWVAHCKEKKFVCSGAGQTVTCNPDISNDISIRPSTGEASKTSSDDEEKLTAKSKTSKKHTK